jgi:hypothetical protein
MAAGLGFKTFTTGEVLTAADTNGYLMQGVLVFASSATRDAAITSPQEGQFAYLKDTNVTTYYTGSAWANLDTTGMTNPMTTTGDTIYSSSGSTPARLGIGTTGQVLTVAGGVPTWAAAAAGGGMTLLSTTTLSGASTTISSIDQTYKNLQIVFYGVNPSSTTEFRLAPNGSTTITSFIGTNSVATVLTKTSGYLKLSTDSHDNVASNTNNVWAINIYNYANTTNYKAFDLSGNWVSTASVEISQFASGAIKTSSAISSLVFSLLSGTFSAGTVLIYGAK